MWRDLDFQSFPAVLPQALQTKGVLTRQHSPHAGERSTLNSRGGKPVWQGLPGSYKPGKRQHRCVDKAAGP